MQRLRRLACAGGALATLTIAPAGALAAGGSSARALPSDAEISAILAERVGADKGSVGIVVGVVAPEGRRVVAYGHRSQGDPRPLDGDTVFEIGSVTKVFTGLLLADMVHRGEVALSDPVAKYLPAGVRIPARNGSSITLLDLATHTSGLPFMPDEAVASADAATVKPTAADLYRWLAGYELRRDIGAEWDYSNLGYWLLEQALTARAARDFESLLRERVLLPLGMKDTAITLSLGLKERLAAGHDASLQPAPWVSALPIYSLMPAAGSLVSTATDLSAFLSAAMGYERSPLASAMAVTLSTRRPLPRPGAAQALGWIVEGEGEAQLISHDGGTFGYASAVAWDPKERVGVVVLSNRLSDVGDIARHLLRPGIPLAKPTATKRVEIVLDTSVLERYVARYEASGEGVFLVALERDFLTLEAPPDWGLPKLRLRPESQAHFFAAELPLRVTFETDAGGRVSSLLIFPPRGHKAVPAKRLDAAE